MCDVGKDANVISIGNYKDHLDKLSDDDLAWYFQVDREGRKIDKITKELVEG